MANLIRRRREGEEPFAPLAHGVRRDPLQLMRDLLRWDPFQEMGALAPLGGRAIFAPDFEVKETTDAYLFKADLPGVKEEDLEISLTGNRVIVSGKREQEEREEGATYYTYERAYGTFSRAFTLPEDVDGDAVRAELRDGVLTLTLPKKPEVRPKRIAVSSAKAGATMPVKKEGEKAKA
jgi:HSP20 family protein